LGAAGFKKIGIGFAAEGTVVAKQQMIRTNQTIVVQGIHHGSTTASGPTHQVIAKNEIVVKVNNLGAEFTENGIKRFRKKGISPIRLTPVLASINTMKCEQSLVATALKSARPRRRGIRYVKDSDLIPCGGQRQAVMAAIHL
jgi:hypothetical protein